MPIRIDLAHEDGLAMSSRKRAGTRSGPKGERSGLFLNPTYLHTYTLHERYTCACLTGSGALACAEFSDEQRQLLLTAFGKTPPSPAQKSHTNAHNVAHSQSPKLTQSGHAVVPAATSVSSRRLTVPAHHQARVAKGRADKLVKKAAVARRCASTASKA